MEKVWLHSTNEEKAEGILREKFKINMTECGRWGYGVYFTDSLKYSMGFGNVTLRASIKDINIIHINYVDLLEKYHDLSIEDEEGTPSLQDYIVNELKYPAVEIEYTNGEVELVVYNTAVINKVTKYIV